MSLSKELDYYERLGLEHGASSDDIKRAFRELARIHHPDRNPNDESAKDRFQLLVEAYDVLSEPRERRIYDLFGRVEPNGLPIETQLSDFVSHNVSRVKQWFGFGGTSKNTVADHIEDIRVSVLESWSGTSKRVSLGGNVLSITIPPGVVDGDMIDMSEHIEGDPKHFVRIHIDSKGRAERHQNDLYIKQVVPLGLAQKGGPLSLNLPNQHLRIQIPAGCEGGTALRIRGKGFPTHRTNSKSRGDLYIVVALRFGVQR